MIGLYLRLAVYAAVLAALAGLEWWVYSKGEAHIQVQWDAQVAQLKAEHDAEVARLESVNRTVEVRYIDRVQPVLQAAKVIEREVPHYVTVEADSRCTVPAGFVRLHDAAAQSRMPETDATGPADDAPSGVALSHVAAVVTANYGDCNVFREQLMSLQEWARGVARDGEEPTAAAKAKRWWQK